MLWVCPPTLATWTNRGCRAVRYDDFLSWMIKCLHNLLLKKYRSIVLQRTFYQLQFWRLRLYITLLYNATCIHISVNSAVELLSRDTALIRNRKRILFAWALKPCRSNVSFARWSDVYFFWAPRTLEACALTLSNSTWLLKMKWNY